ncbi:exodeoxyribonuclease VII, small subunit [Thioalkalivibrio sp. K90mix]|jgi:exodeoxyribonuclease VII small subunit|uniref:exodeoxyribonuclease VII small subunit n=1 Tax=unclassified Thioalkalivibrio TaxID=2621013 RepID=UPI000195AA82|nr:MULTISPECIES: exodeoxyribonuclease VII small subunit [unclassified Thioalkalivibrio]ADC70932.1 exodeoxyribonuclease VII, small subunit [Thioalkalivibrio sp. K90mix]
MTDTSTDSPAEFEASLEALEALVARMESGELGLEQSLEEFQRGMELVGLCQKALDDAQARIEKLASAPAEQGTVSGSAAGTPTDPDDVPF